MSAAGIRTATNKANKPVYKHLSRGQKVLVKLEERSVQINKGVGHFFSVCPRTIAGAVDWAKWEKKDPMQYDYFCDLLEEQGKMSKRKSNAEARYATTILQAMTRFTQGQFRLGQSF